MSRERPGRGYRYGRWRGGPDPLAPPYDLGNAVDEIGDSVLAGSGVREALRELLRRGSEGRQGLDELRRTVRDRLRQARQAGRMDGTLQEVRELLDRALDAERRALFPDPDDSARLAESELDALPEDTAGAVRALKDYPWRSDEARQAYEQIQDLLRREVLDSSFASMKQALQGAGPEEMQAIKDMVADLSRLIDAHNRGEDTDEQFRDFMDRHGQFFPENPESVEELIDSLARRAAAQERMMAGLTPEQRAELADLMSQAMSDMGLAGEMAHLQDALRQARPDLPWGQRGPVPDGEQGLGLGDATSAVAELADLEALSNQLSQGYAGASLADIDEELLERALGRNAVDDLAALRQLERELERQGFLNRSDGRLELSPKAVRRLGATALRRVFAKLESTGRGEHDVTDAGSAGELTGSSREWQFGDEQPLDVVRTVKNAVLRTAHAPGAMTSAPAGRTGHRAVRIAVDDFEVVETERRTGAAVALLVDLSYSMALRGTWGAAKSTAMALHSLVTTRFPQDAIQIIGFSSTAQVLRPETLAELSVDTLQGTNLQHGLMLARRFLAHHRDAEPVVLVVTDGEPTAHLEEDGTPFFCWPPMPETIARTVAEVERVARGGATINVFALDPDPGLVHFVHDITKRAGGRVFEPDTERLGEYVVADYLRARRGGRSR
jgi:uncharacterized protein with von Willebrand factor type A (vWA) domain